MTDFNKIVNDLADLIADRVVERINNNPGNWPPADVETKNSGHDLDEPRFDIEPGGEDTPPWKADEPEPIISKRLERTAHWTSVLEKSGRDAITKLLKAAGEDLRGYARLSDEALVGKVVDLELLTGKELDDATEEDIVEPEAEDVEPEELTRESALELDLADLKAVAVDAGVEESSLKGLDVDAIVDLLFGESAPEAAEDEEVELTEDQVREASIAELKGWADEFGIEYTRTTSRNDLIEAILSGE